MLYGHIEEPRHRVDHVLRLRELQDETNGFAVFIPLRFQHDFHDSKDGKQRNRLMTQPMATGAEALKTFAVSRLLLDNFDHVKCFWVMHGLGTAQLSLNYGVDDLDGSVVEYKITHDADDFGTPNKMSRDEPARPDPGRRLHPGRAQHPLRGRARVPGPGHGAARVPQSMVFAE
jgi:aminodeoxyfutalosine synthase